MFGKKVILMLVLLFGVAAFMTVSLGTASANRPRPNSPPICNPINFFIEGYWGVECIDAENNIAFAEVTTDGVVIHLYWDNSFAKIIVQTDDNTNIRWRVCDSFMACTGGVHP